MPASLRHPQVSRENAILDSLESSYVPLVARALRAIGEWALRQHQPALESALHASDPRCRLEAAYALRLFGHDVGMPDLAEHFPPLAMPMRRRLLLSMASTASAAHCADAYAALLQAGQGRDALWLQIFRGDAHALAHLAAALDGEYAALAAYGLEHITGVNLDDIDCWERPDPMAPVTLKPAGGEPDDAVKLDDDDDPELDVHAEDSGLPTPVAERLRAWLAAQPVPQGRRLSSVPIDTAMQITSRAHLTLPQCWQLAFLHTLHGRAGAIDAIHAPVL